MGPYIVSSSVKKAAEDERLYFYVPYLLAKTLRFARSFEISVSQI